MVAEAKLSGVDEIGQMRKELIVREDQAASATQDACSLVRSHKESRDTESKVLPLNGIGYNLKARKPYTIKKQRERWSEEEHLKFIEALKLYGRAWRQIEEHVGTKTAIQIRSHAQKFFAKVSRDFSTDVGGSSTPIEIPPPRPKKKPLHPYPRKIADSSKTEVLDPHQQETSNSPDVSVTERDDLSPTSVLADVAELHESRLSPTSCDTTDERSGNLLYTKKDEDHVTSNISDVVTDGSRSPMGSSVSALNDKSITKFELFPQETEYGLSSSNAAEPLPSIKLFGKTVVVRETMKLYIEVEGNSEPLPPSVINSSESNDENFVQTLASKYSCSQVDFGSVSECVTPYSLPHPLLHNGYYHMENVITLPWSTWYRGVAYPYPSSCNKTAPQNSADFSQKGLKDEESQNSAYNSGKGFVPYKRCLAEKEDNVSMSVLQKREGQRARVCS